MEQHYGRKLLRALMGHRLTKSTIVLVGATEMTGGILIVSDQTTKRAIESGTHLNPTSRYVPLSQLELERLMGAEGPILVDNWAVVQALQAYEDQIKEIREAAEPPLETTIRLLRQQVKEAWATTGGVGFWAGGSLAARTLKLCDEIEERIAMGQNEKAYVLKELGRIATDFRSSMDKAFEALGEKKDAPTQP